MTAILAELPPCPVPQGLSGIREEMSRGPLLRREVKTAPRDLQGLEIAFCVKEGKARRFFIQNSIFKKETKQCFGFW